MTRGRAIRRSGHRAIILTLGLLVTPLAAFAQEVDHGGHTIHDKSINFKVLFDQFEAQLVHGEAGSRWDNRSWIGGDVHRFVVRSEGEAVAGILDAAEVQLLYSRAFTPWWEAVAGVRFDARPSPSHTWFAIGVQGLAPQMIDVQATAYIGESGHLAGRVELEHDMHITQRIVFQPLVELSLSGSEDPDRGIGAGLSTGEVGFRFRYEIKRELAPYVGVVWHRKLFGTGDFARERGEDAGGWHVVAGLRFWM